MIEVRETHNLLTRWLMWSIFLGPAIASLVALTATGVLPGYVVAVGILALLLWAFVSAGLMVRDFHRFCEEDSQGTRLYSEFLGRPMSKSIVLTDRLIITTMPCGARKEIIPIADIVACSDAGRMLGLPFGVGKIALSVRNPSTVVHKKYYSRYPDRLVAAIEQAMALSKSAAQETRTVEAGADVA